jgi:Rrf2 family transcriptional regulator, cysteine metabolism repressor|uniref:RrF2 family transcriptional regulator n=1 Tax=Cephaloticoccus sp. TaxID=1985742 RepID=UPI00404B5387
MLSHYLSSLVKISVKIDYACRVLAEMARFQGTGELAQIDHLAKTEAVPANFLAQILGELRNGGLVVSKRGIQGGYALAKPPDQISLYDIIKVIDGELIEFSGNYDGRSGRRMKEIWGDIRATLDEKAKSYTLDTLVAKDDAEMYHI